MLERPAKGLKYFIPSMSLSALNYDNLGDDPAAKVTVSDVAKGILVRGLMNLKVAREVGRTRYSRRRVDGTQSSPSDEA